MGSCHSVLLGSQKKEDISYSDIEHKHGKAWNSLASEDDDLFLISVFRFCLFMGVSCNNIPNDEEQSPVALRLPKNGLILLTQLKNWIGKNFSVFNAAKFNSPVYQEPIYRSPGVGQQMGKKSLTFARYSIVLQIEKHDAFYQGANRPQMLPWNAYEPPPNRVTGGGSWYIVSMEVFKDGIDQIGSRCPDNPEVHLKVILHIANRRMTWTPPEFSPFDVHSQTETYRYNDVLNPYVLKYHVDYTLSPEELCQLVRIQKYLLANEQPKDPIPRDARALIPGLLEFNHDSIHLDCRNLNISSNLNTVLNSSYYKSDLYLNFPNPVPSTSIPNQHWLSNEAMHKDHQDANADRKFKKCPPYTIIKAEHTRTLAPGPPKFNHDAITFGYRNLNICSNPITVLDSSYYKSDLNLDFTNTVPSIIIPNSNWPNNEAIHEDHKDVNANGNSKKRPLSTNNKSGNRAAPGLKAICILLLLAPTAAAIPVSQYRQVEIEILRDSNDLNCTLKIDKKYSLCYGDCDQNQKHHQHFFNDTVKTFLGNLCEKQNNSMEANQISIMKHRNLSSGTLQLILIWELDKDLNLKNVSVRYIFDGNNLTDEDKSNLPMPIIDFMNNDRNRHVYMEMVDYVKKSWEDIRETLLPFLKIDDQPENTNSSVNGKANIRNSWKIAIAFIFVGVIGTIAIVWNMKCSGKEACKKLYETCLNYRRGGQNEVEAEDDPNVMEALREDHVADSV